MFFTSAVFYSFRYNFFFLFAENLLQYMDSQRFFFQNLTDIFFLQIYISFFFGFFFALPFLILQIGSFFFSSFFLYEFKQFFIYFSFFLISYLLSFLSSYYILVPNFSQFLLFFEINPKIFPLHFDAQFESYFTFLVSLYLNNFFFFQIPLCIHLFQKYVYDIPFSKFRKYCYIIFFILSIIISPPDLFIQGIYFCFFVFIFEIYIYFKLFWKNLIF